MKNEKDEILSRLGHKISVERKKKGITLEKLAYEMGISKGNLSDIESGKKNPTFFTLKAIAEGLSTTISNLLKGF